MFTQHTGLTTYKYCIPNVDHATVDCERLQPNVDVSVTDISELYLVSSFNHYLQKEIIYDNFLVKFKSDQDLSSISLEEVSITYDALVAVDKFGSDNDARYYNIINWAQQSLTIFPSHYHPCNERLDVTQDCLHVRPEQTWSKSGINCLLSAALQNLSESQIKTSYANFCCTLDQWLSQCIISYSSMQSLPDCITTVCNDCPFDWTSFSWQYLLYKFVLRPDFSYLPNSTYQHQYALLWTRLIEKTKREVDGILLNFLSRCLQQIANERQTNNSPKPFAYSTLYYPQNPYSSSLPCISWSDVRQSQLLHPFSTYESITLRTESGFGSTTGRTIWPASFLMSEFILYNSTLFKNRRCLELGSGIGLVGVIAARCNPSLLVLTDGDYSAIDNLNHNLEINGCYKGKNRDSTSNVQAHHLDWEFPSEKQLDGWSPDIILSCDTIYLPEHHVALANLVKRTLQRTPGSVCYFSQVERTTDVFEAYEQTFRSIGLRIDEVDFKTIPRWLFYERNRIRLQCITLQ